MSKPIYRHCSLRFFDRDWEHHRAAQAPLELVLHGDELDAWRTNGALEAIRRLKADYNPPLSLHGPVFGFDPASHDKGLAALTEKRALLALEAAEEMQAEVIVFHSSFNYLAYGFERDYWRETSSAFYLRLLEQLPPERRIVVENIHEVEPTPLASLVHGIDDARLGHCFDVGHFNMFCKTVDMADWLAAFAGRLGHIHLHDNQGREDLHHPPGTGTIDYTPLLKVLKTAPEPWSVTVECKNTADNDQAVAWTTEYLPLG